MKRLGRACVVLISLVLLLHGCGGRTSYAPTKTAFLVYMIGSNLESIWNLGTANINEMMSVGSSNEVMILLTTGGAKKEGWMTVKRHEVHKDALVTLEDVGSISMGNTDTLRDFIIWGVNTYPAEKYVLVMWDHGGGAIGGFGADELYNREGLSLPMMNQALAEAYAVTGRTFEVIGFDACLMGNTETAFSMKPYARYLVASEDLEANEGWDYAEPLRYLSGSGYAADGVTLGKVIADSYKLKIDTIYKGRDFLTLSVVDLDRLSNGFLEAIDRFSASIRGRASQSRDGWLAVANDRSRSLDFATSRLENWFYDMVDLKDLVMNMRSIAPDESDALASAIEQAVVYNIHTNRSDAYGLTVYFPTGSIKKKSYYEKYMTLDFPDSYKTMIADYIATGIQDVTPPVFSGEYKSGDRFSATVTGDDIDNVGSFISQTNAKGEKVMLGMKPSEPGEKGAVSMDWTGLWLSLNGVVVSSFIEVPGDAMEILGIPVSVNEEPSLLIVNHNKITGTMAIEGVWPQLEIANHLSEKLLKPLKAGDQVAPGFQVYKPSTGEIALEFGEIFTLFDPIILADSSLKSGNYDVAFVATDLAYNYGWSGTVTFNVGGALKSIAQLGQARRTDPAFAAAAADIIRRYRGR